MEYAQTTTETKGSNAGWPVTSHSVWGTHSYSWNFNGRSGHCQWVKCIVESVSSAGHCELTWHWWKGFVSKEITIISIFDGCAKHISANLVGCVDPTQIRVTWINSSCCNMKCLLWEMHLRLCTYHLPSTVLDATTCDRTVLQTSTTMHLYYHVNNYYYVFKIHQWYDMVYSNKYSTRQGHELKDHRSHVISWNITWLHVQNTCSCVWVYDGRSRTEHVPHSWHVYMYSFPMCQNGPLTTGQP